VQNPLVGTVKNFTTSPVPPPPSTPSGFFNLAVVVPFLFESLSFLFSSFADFRVSLSFYCRLSLLDRLVPLSPLSPPARSHHLLFCFLIPSFVSPLVAIFLIFLRPRSHSRFCPPFAPAIAITLVFPKGPLFLADPPCSSLFSTFKGDRSLRSDTRFCQGFADPAFKFSTHFRELLFFPVFNFA